MKKSVRPFVWFMILSAASLPPLSTSCGSPVEVGADIKGYVEDGMTIVSLGAVTMTVDGRETAVVPSGKRVVVTVDLVNRRSVELSCGVRCTDETLFDSLPQVAASNRTRTSFSFIPSLRSERKDLAFTLELSAPKLDRTFPQETVTIHCNTPPGSVESTLDAALNASGCAFAAFRLPSAPTDDDLAQVRISYAPLESPGSIQTITIPAGDACLCSVVHSVDGRDLLGSSDPLNRYFQPTGIGGGDDYLFTVVTIDGEGLESTPAEITSDATEYTVTYDGNGDTGGAAPVDPLSYRQTKSVTVLDAGTLARTGYTFAGWTTDAGGSATLYQPGSVYAMGAGNTTFYARWVQHQPVNVTCVLNPTYRSITFDPPTPSVERGTDLEIAGSTATEEPWNWYVDGVKVDGQTTATFTWSTLGKQPGQYIVSADVEYYDEVFERNIVCTGSFRVTVTY